MRNLAATLFIAIFATAILACGSDTPAPSDTVAPPPATQAPTNAADTPIPAPTATPAPTNTPTPQPQPTNTPVPTARITVAPEPTNTPEPTPQPSPEPTAAPTPDPTAAPTPDPTATPEPTETPATTEPEPMEDPVAADLAALGDNLLWVAHYDNATGEWSIYDPSGTLSPEMLPLPPGQSTENLGPLATITRLVPGKIYWLNVKEAQTAVLGGKSRTLGAGLNPAPW